MTRKWIARVIALLSVVAGSDAAVADAYVQAVPTAWRLQNYVGGNMVVYYAGSPCSQGELIMPGGSSDADKDRLWSLIMTAKAGSTQVGIYYETASGSCNITSFYYAP